MTEKELRRLKRHELLVLLRDQEYEIAALNAQVEALEQQLQKKELMLEESGNLAEASLRINHVFEAAQAAADQYIKSIKAMAEPRQNEKFNDEPEDKTQE